MSPKLLNLKNSIKSSADRDGQSDVPAVQGEQTSVIYPEGEADTEEVDFITRLKSGLSSGMIEINTPSARVHCIAGYVFLCVPDIFFICIRKMTGSRRDRRSVQALFERSRIHKNPGR
ncbi:DNA-binding domain-containing protein [Escherichia coli]